MAGSSLIVLNGQGKVNPTERIHEGNLQGNYRAQIFCKTWQNRIKSVAALGEKRLFIYYENSVKKEKMR